MSKANTKTLRKLIEQSCIALLIIFSSNVLHGQSYKLFKNSGYHMPFVVMIIQDTIFNDMNYRVIKSINSSNASFFLVNGSKVTSADLKDTVNSILNSNLSISKSNVYLLMVGSKSFFEMQNRFLYEIFVYKYFIQTDSGEINNKEFKALAYHNLDFQAVLKALFANYLWQIDIDRIEQNYKLGCQYPHKEFGFGSSATINYPVKVRTAAYIKNSFISFGIMGYRSFNENNKIIANFQFGFKKPSPTSGSMEGYTYIYYLMEARHLFLKNKKLKPFIGSGVSYTMYSSMMGNLETISSGRANMEQTIFQYPGINFTTGFEYAISDKAIFVFNSSYNLSMNSFNRNSSTLNNFDLQFGLNLRILGKKKCLYEYLRLK